MILIQNSRRYQCQNQHYNFWFPVLGPDLLYQFFSGSVQHFFVAAMFVFVHCLSSAHLKTACSAVTEDDHPLWSGGGLLLFTPVHYLFSTDLPSGLWKMG